MKYALLIYNNLARWEAAADAERNAELDVHNKLIAELTESGEFIGLVALANEAKVVTAAGSVPAVTDGPYGETKEQMASVWIIDTETEQRALDIAALIAHFTPVEVRPLMHTAGLEM